MSKAKSEVGRKWIHEQLDNAIDAGLSPREALDHVADLADKVSAPKQKAEKVVERIIERDRWYPRPHRDWPWERVWCGSTAENTGLLPTGAPLILTMSENASELA